MALDKPYGVACQFRDHPVHPTLATLVPLPGLYPAGRLDRDSEGLVLLTDDEGLQHRLARPGGGTTKRYWVQVEGEPTTAALERLRRGGRLDGRRTRPAEVQRIDAPANLWPRDPPIRVRRHIPTAWLATGLDEGRNRQVRRMTAAGGLPALRRVRHRIGPCTVAGLAPGEWREVPVRLLDAAEEGR